MTKATEDNKWPNMKPGEIIMRYEDEEAIAITLCMNALNKLANIKAQRRITQYLQRAYEERTSA